MWPDTIPFFSAAFWKTGLHLTPESIYMEEEYGVNKFKECAI